MKLAICSPLPSVWMPTKQKLTDLIEQAKIAVKELDVDLIIVLAIAESHTNKVDYADMAMQDPTLKVIFVNEGEHSSALLYLKAFEHALLENADILLEMDLIGTHNPKEIPNLVRPLLNKSNQLACVLSTRFSHGGKNTYPVYRTSVSVVGTILSKLLLGLGKVGWSLTDLTSGYEAFTKPLVEKMFSTLPIQEWISVRHGPLHLFQTEVRAVICWLVKKQTIDIEQVGITFGQDLGKKPRKVKLEYLTKSFAGLLLLITLRNRFKNKA